MTSKVLNISSLASDQLPFVGPNGPPTWGAVIGANILWVLLLRILGATLQCARVAAQVLELGRIRCVGIILHAIFGGVNSLEFIGV